MARLLLCFKPMTSDDEGRGSIIIILAVIDISLLIGRIRTVLESPWLGKQLVLHIELTIALQCTLF